MDSRDLMLYEDARKLGVALELMRDLSCETSLGFSLKNSMSKLASISEGELFKDFEAVQMHCYRLMNGKHSGIEWRAKSMESIDNKILRSKLAEQEGLVRPIEKVFNDLVGLRILVNDYGSVKGLICPGYRIIDMTEGKAKDDGYRGIHIYYQPDHRHYPVELQVMTQRDHLFNGWLHEATYKIRGREDLGKALRQLYERGVITDRNGFEETLNVLLGS